MRYKFDELKQTKWKDVEGKPMTKVDNDLIKLGVKKGLIKIEEGRIEYLEQKKTYDFTDPEEPVRARTFVKLVLKNKYPANRIDLEVYPPRRIPKLPADIVVYEDDEKEHVYIIVESKPTSQKSAVEEAKREGLGNANLLNSRFLMLACGDVEIAYDIKERPSLASLDKFKIPTIPIFYGRIPKYRFIKGKGALQDLSKATLNELMRKFQKCHDAIWEGGKRDPAIAFDEMSKLMFAKIYDERFTKVGDSYDFQIGSYENPYVVAKKVREIYQQIQDKEPEVFQEPIKVPDNIVFEVVNTLQDISLIKTDLDAKGRAFENFLGRVFRGEFGQFFTSREIVDFMVRMVDPDERDLVMDPACGSGGFLLYSIKLVREKIKRNFAGDEKTIIRLDYDFSHYNVFGIEINDRIARVAMMDMVIHDDGHTNIECNDALEEYKKFDPRRDIKPNKYDLVLTNPPFGAFEEGQGILKKFELGSKLRKRSRQRKEILFIERCLELLKVGGKMGIVLPEGVLSNITSKYVRDFIINKARILAVISLPPHAFLPFGSAVKASLLFLQKKEPKEKVKDYRIFMASADHIGYDATGRPEKNELRTILKEYMKFRQNPDEYVGDDWKCGRQI